MSVVIKMKLTIVGGSVWPGVGLYERQVQCNVDIDYDLFDASESLHNVLSLAVREAAQRAGITRSKPKTKAERTRVLVHRPGRLQRQYEATKTRQPKK